MGARGEGREAGSISAAVLGMLLFVSLLFIGGSLFLELAMRDLRRGAERDGQRRLLVQEADRVVRLLLADATPFADSPLDAVWARAAGAAPAGVTVALSDVSSRMALNGVRKEVLAELDVLLPGKTVQDLQQFREETGIHADLTRAFGDFIEKERIEELFTAYGWFNVNTCDEFVLRRLFLLRSGDPQGAEEFHARIQRARIGREVVSPEALEGFLGPQAFALLFPLVNAEPAMNVHFVPEGVLRALFAHFDVPAGRAREILDRRSSSEWTEGGLESLIGVPYRATLLHEYLGTRTWFWRIEVSSDRARLVRVVARVPAREETEAAELRLLEEVYTP